MTGRGRVFALAALAAAGCALGPGDRGAQGTRAEYERLRQQLASRVAQDTVVREASAIPGNVRVAVRPALVESVLRRAAAVYLDRVELDLPLGLRFAETGAVGVRVMGRRIQAGEWRVDGVLHRAQGVFRARAPELQPADAERIAVRLPVALAAGHGSATVHFQWDGRSVGRLACRDFEVKRTLRGVVLPGEYTMVGAFRLSAGPRGLRAEPEFPASRHRLRVDLTAESWREVEEALAEQDRLLRCGLALDPKDVRTRLSALLRRGFRVALPRSLFRTLDFPAGVRQSVEVEDRRVDLSVEPAGLRVGEDAVWYGATVSTVVQRDTMGALPGRQEASVCSRSETTVYPAPRAPRSSPGASSASTCSPSSSS